MPKVSIIVPVYNVEKYLSRCMDSLLNQTLKDIEIILVDDGSPDNCPAICDEYAKQDHRVKVVHKKNGGLGYARNSGMEMASGEFLAFVDSDDFVDVTMYEKLLKCVEENKLDTCYCRMQKYYPSGKIIPMEELAENKIFEGRSEVDTFLLKMFGGEEYEGKNLHAISVCKALYSTALIRKHNIKFLSEREMAAEDLFFNIDYLSRAEKVGWINELMYYYFYNSASTTTSYSQRYFNTVKNTMNSLAPYLDKYYSYQFYKNYYSGTILGLQKIIFKKEILRKDISYGNLRRFLKQECNNPLFRTMKVGHLPVSKQIYLLAIKYKLVDLIFLIVKLKNKLSNHQ